jgi:hypothetical protein
MAGRVRGKGEDFETPTRFTLPLAGGGKIVRGEGDEDHPFGMGGDIIEMKLAFAFLGAALAQGQQAAQPAIGRAVAGISEQARRVLEIEADADDQLDAGLLGGEMSTDRAGERVPIGDGDGREAKRLRRRHQFLGMRAAAQEREVGGDIELGVRGYRVIPA